MKIIKDDSRYGLVTKSYFKFLINGSYFSTFDDLEYASSYAKLYEDSHPGSTVTLEEFIVAVPIPFLKTPSL